MNISAISSIAPKCGLRILRAFMLGLGTALLGMVSAPSSAAPACSFSSTSSVGFGSYNVYSATPNNNGIGQLVILCKGGGGPSFVVTLSTGQSNNFVARFMTSGTKNLNYNLYINSTRTTIWGDGTAGSSTMSALPNSSTTLTVYGQIPAGQDVPIGNYSDNITATVTF
jgi:spore coat protein U-like protein